jgi:hypothetical protein
VSWTLAVLIALVLGLAGCSGDDDEPDDEPGSTSESPAVETLPTTAQVGKVTGRLGKAPARRLAADVAAVVDRWIDGAYVAGDYPRTSFGDAFRGFSKGAARLAAQQRGVMSNAAVGDRVETVTARKRIVRVDVLSPRGEPAGVTANVNLVIRLEGKVQRTDRIRGRLLLTPRGKSWQVFGFDIDRGEVRR